jgi:phosphatidylserine/phosphatidylglycerophosphate/cardiolipin synthase-like enzyme
LADDAAWRELVEHPRLRIYQTGRNDAVRLGGEITYGKLHAKFIVDGDLGFVGTSNFDYRSRLFNNEMGFFVESPSQGVEIHDAFEYLKGLSYRWGSPEWLEMRERMMASGGIKAWTVRRQRTIYNFLKATGLKYLF